MQPGAASLPSTLPGCHHSSPTKPGGTLRGACAPRPAHRAGPGLVDIQTSDTRHLNARQQRNFRKRATVLTSARLIQEARQTAERPDYLALLTLTYAEPTDWQPYHLTKLVKTIRQHLARRGHRLRYVWCAELQRRGAIHYHLALWLPHGLRLPKPDEAGWWTHGATNIEKARKGAAYLAKYVAKPDAPDAKLPRGARVAGAGGLTPQQLAERRWWRLPARIREETTPQDDVRPAPGGGHTARATGQHWPSAFGFAYKYRQGGTWIIVLRRKQLGYDMTRASP